MSPLTPLFVLFVIGCVHAANCPTGGTIYAMGMTAASKKTVVDLHNKYRLDIANGRVKNQPRGINLKRVKFDQILSDKARPVSKQCKMAHIFAKDSRWSTVGQNIYIEWTSSKTDAKVQNWKRAVDYWFNEHKYFTYPSTAAPGKETMHYRQLVFASTSHIGCDFIYFYDKTRPSTPYVKMYTCNYGAGVNYGAPYKKGTSGCANLC